MRMRTIIHTKGLHFSAFHNSLRHAVVGYPWFYVPQTYIQQKNSYSSLSLVPRLSLLECNNVHMTFELITKHVVIKCHWYDCTQHTTLCRHLAWYSIVCHLHSPGLELLAYPSSPHSLYCSRYSSTFASLHIQLESWISIFRVHACMHACTYACAHAHTTWWRVWDWWHTLTRNFWKQEK